VIAIFSFGIWRIPHLSSFLKTDVCRIGLLTGAAAANIDAVAGWGQRPSTRRARAYASRHGLPFVALEDGFLRSCGLGVHGAPPLSLVVDDLGIYYDATQPSRLETLIATLAMDDVLQAQTVRAMGLIREHRLSKYNQAPEVMLSSAQAPSGLRDAPSPLPSAKPPPGLSDAPSPQPSPASGRGSEERVLVIDQTFGDVSVRLGGADATTFQRMLIVALADNPDAEIWVKVHPDVLWGKKQGYLGTLVQDDRLHLLAQDVAPLSLLEQVDKVYVVTSQMGFEALMLGKPVVCFGQPWYAGWGLTDDRHPGMAALHARRGVARTLEQLFAAAYLRYARYIAPDTGAPGTIFDVIEHLARNKALNDATRGTLYCVGMSLWKRAIVRPFLSTPSSRVHFVRSSQALARSALPPDARIVIWGTRAEQEIRLIAQERQVPLWRMEDGFLRSVGLGSDLFRPVSLVLDRSGMYYDPASNSDLEQMLATQTLSQASLARAAQFRRAFVAMRMSKYNLGHAPLLVESKGRRVLLVPGQVEDDASILRGSPLVRSNLALLQAVREANPDAWILYKAHPDVVAGNRRGILEEISFNKLADQCVAQANIIDCILAADEVHTMTSLSGFEALLHGRVVHCYGGPFYAGWGLTVDHFALPQRGRSITLNELVFAVMLDYPRYVLPGMPGFVSAEAVMVVLSEQAQAATRTVPATGWRGWLQRKGRKASALTQLIRDEWKAARP
jgi:capsular polysaccharide export protein